AWRDTVHAHPRSQLCCQLPNHPYHGVLGGGIQHAAPTGVKAGDGRRKYHTALGLDEFRQRRFGSQEATLDIDVELLVKGCAERVLRQILEPQEAVKNPSVSYKDVQLTKSPHRFCYRPLIVLQARDVSLDRVYRRAKVFSELLYPVGEALQNAYTRAFCKKAGHNAPPNT